MLLAGEKRQRPKINIKSHQNTSTPPWRHVSLKEDRKSRWLGSERVTHSYMYYTVLPTTLTPDVMWTNECPLHSHLWLLYST